MAFPEKVSYHDLILAALHVMDRDRELSLQAVAKHLRVKPPSLYRHVSSLAELEGDVATEGYRLLGIAMQKAVDADRSWLALATAYRRFALDHPQLYRLMSGPRGRARRGTDALQVLIKPLGDLLGIDPNSDEFILKHRPAWAFIHGFVLLELENQFLRREGIDEAFELGVRILERALPRRRRVAGRRP